MGKRLYVGNLPYDADDAALRAAFAQDGRRVERIHIVLDRETQRPRGFAFVEMATDDEARAAIAALDGTMFGMRQLRVTEAEDRRTGPGAPRGPGQGGQRAVGGGAGRPAAGGGAAEDGGRGRNFGPDARPARERARELEHRRAANRRRGGGDDDDAWGGRRGNRRFDEDDDE